MDAVVIVVHGAVLKKEFNDARCGVVKRCSVRFKVLQPARLAWQIPPHPPH